MHRLPLTNINLIKSNHNENWVIGADWIDTRDGNAYSTIPIGDQVWMAENMAYLPFVYNLEDGSEDEGYESDPFYYVLGYDGTEVSAVKATSNYQKYSVLYNWHSALEACPAGWHLPTDAKWTELTDFLGGLSVAGGKLKETGTTHWESPNTTATNEVGFTALPSGYCNSNGSFESVGYHHFLWSATEGNSSRA